MNYHAQKFEGLLKAAKSIVIMSPDSPDVDSVSSNLALAETLKSMGKSVVLVANDPIPDDLTWLLESWKYLTKPDLPKIKHTKPDLCLFTDAGGLSMFSRLLDGDDWLVKGIPVVVIDHHATRDDFKPDAAIIDADAAATGELLFNLYKQLGWEITPRIASLMQAGILADTGSFRNSNSDSSVLRATSELIELGANLYELQEIYSQASAFDEAKFKVLSELMSQVVFDGQVVYGLIPYHKVARFGPNSGMTVALGQQIRFLKGVRVSFVLAEKDDSSIRLSMRSQPPIDVSKVAAHFGGGGHKVAAGASITNLTLEQAAKRVLDLVKAEIHATP